jgi:hypothetical protein
VTRTATAAVSAAAKSSNARNFDRIRRCIVDSQHFGARRPRVQPLGKPAYSCSRTNSEHFHPSVRQVDCPAPDAQPFRLTARARPESNALYSSGNVKAQRCGHDIGRPYLRILFI